MFMQDFSGMQLRAAPASLISEGAVLGEVPGSQALLVARSLAGEPS